MSNPMGVSDNIAAISNRNTNFRDYLWANKSNRRLLWLSFIAILTQFFIFKYFYPEAGFIDGDSYSYLDTAFWNLGINTYMVGYSMFLRLFSVFTTSDFAVVAFQYFFIGFGALLLVFSIFYFFQPSKLTKYILLIFVVINPLFLYMANYISSDGYFLALSLVWFSSLLWIINKPSAKLIVYSTLLLFLCFTVRYNALLYPFIFFLTLLFTKIKIRVKLLGLGLALLLIGGFVVYNVNKYKELTGYWQYSPFSGWQLTNNAMYAYKFVDRDKRLPVPGKYVRLDNMIRKYFDTATNPFTHPEILLKASTVYMWDPRLPLYKYRDGLFAKDTTASELKKWASMGPFYAEYGLFIIRQYPACYFKYFVWPNTCKYYAPPVEFLDHYNSGEDSVKPPAMVWFKYKSLKAKVRTKDLSVSMLNYYPILTGVINVVYLLSLLCLISVGFLKMNTPIRNSLVLITLFWLGNAAFTILSSSAALRFQATPIILVTLFSFTLLDVLYKTALKQEEERKQSTILADNISFTQ